MPAYPLLSQTPSEAVQPWLALLIENISQKVLWYSHNPSSAILLLATFGTLVLLFASKIYFTRLQVPASQVRITRPPLNLSASAMRYLLSKGMDSKTPIVSMLNAAIHGCYHITWRANGFVAERNPAADFSAMSEVERDALCYAKNNYWDRVHFSHTPNGVTRRMAARLEQNLSVQYRKLFRQNWGWLAFGIMASLASLWFAFGVNASFSELKWFFAYTFIFALAIVLPIIFLMQVVRDRYWFGILYASVFMMVGMWALIYIESQPGTPLYSIAFVPTALLHFYIARKLPNYTVQGRRIMQAIFAYRQYLKSQFDDVAAGNIPIGQVVQDMPYALALDLDYGFTRYFDPILGKTKYEPYQIFNTIYGHNEKFSGQL